ncbi:hypothetical protein EDD11_001487 [Mortierella claussenii]|nr:hypothetical protein EDD11_001487 [Mortierella claussenii]
MARKNRQRPPLQPLTPGSPDTHSTQPRVPATSTISANSKTASADSTSHSNIPAIASISSISSVNSVSTVAPSATSSPVKDKEKGKDKSMSTDRSRLTKSKGGGFFGTRSTSATGSAMTAALGSKKQGTTSKSDTVSASSAPVLPLLLPAFEDFELSLPFMTELTSSTPAAPTATSTFNPTTTATAITSTTTVQSRTSPVLSSPPSPQASSPSYSTSRSSEFRPSFSSFTPSSGHFLTSQSSRLQDFAGPSLPSTPRSPAPPSGTTSAHSISSSNHGTANFQRKPNMHSKITTIDASGTIHQGSPLDLSRLELTDYFVRNGDGPASRKSSIKNPEQARSEATGDLELGKGHVKLGAPTSDDLLSPPRFVIRQPSLSALSGASKTTSPTPSQTSSLISDKSSMRSSQHAQSLHQIQQYQQEQNSLQLSHRLIKDHDTLQQQNSNASQSETNIVPEATGARTDRSGKPSTVNLFASSSAPTPTPKKVAASKQVQGLGHDSQPANLRSRLTRLFRSNPKPERPPSAEHRNRDQQRSVRQVTVSSGSRQLQSQLQSQTLTMPKAQPQPQPQVQTPIQQGTQSQRQQASGVVSAPATVSASVPLPVLTSTLTPIAASQKQSSPSMTESPSYVHVDQRKGHGLQREVESNLFEEKQRHNLASKPPHHIAEATPVPLRQVQTRDTPVFSGVQAPFFPGAASNPVVPPASPLTREENKARQRRVSSVSSSHSIRQIGTYGDGYVNPNKMISPARKANPYYSGVVARFASGGKHSLHGRDLSASGKRRSLVSVGGERARVGAEATSSKEKLHSVDATVSEADNARRPSVVSTTSSAIYEARDNIPTFVGRTAEQVLNGHKDGQSWSSSAAAPQAMCTATYSEEDDTERDKSAPGSLSGSPFGIVDDNVMRGPLSNIRPHINTLPTSPAKSRTFMLASDTKPSQMDDIQRGLERPVLPEGLPFTSTAWSTITSAHTDVGTIPDSVDGTAQTESEYSRTMPSFESQDSDVDSDADATPSFSTLSSAQIRRYREQGIITTEEWDESETHQNALPLVLVHRPSMDVSILPDQPPFAQSTKPMSTTSSILSASSDKRPQHQAKRFASVGQWSESSYDPCAPLRWDELFEMDPNSKGPLWLSHRGLGQIPHEFFDGLRNLRELYLDHNDIKVVPDSLLKLSKLDVLDLSCNSISSFHSAFKLKKLKNLRRLNLDHNMLTDISPIYKLKSLRELRMSHNFVPYLAIAIHNMAKLKILAMESNSLATLPETMGKLGNLCELRLSDNNLRTLPESIGSIRTLQVLALRSNLLEKLPESWKDMENLSTLDLACNRLTSLPGDIVRLPKLTHLDLHDNQIEVLPDKIGQLSNLIVLQLCNNQLRELPKDIGRLRDLHDLVLSFNQLQFLPDEIGKLSKLQDLKFDNNPLRVLPKTIQRLTSVRRVYLQGCQLRDLPVELGVAFRELVYLDLSGNQFEVMPALDQMAKLEELYISNNHLREIGTSSLNLQSSSNSNSYTSSTASGSIGGGSGLVSHSQAGSGTMSQCVQASGPAAGQSGGVGNSSVAQGPSGYISTMTGGGLTASKLSELKRLKVFEAHGNQIRVLTPKIKLLSNLEVLDLADNLLTWLPKEVGDLADLKVLILEGNPVKSLPSSLSKLMGTLEVFRIGEWPENGFEITRDQSQVNMKINALQSFMPQQIERTLLLRMHDSILKRVQELDSQQYRDQHDMDKANGSKQGSKALASTSSRLSSSTFNLSANTSQPTRSSSPTLEGRPRLGITQGLAIATQNMMINRSFALPPAQSGSDSASSDALLTVNSEGINLGYTDYTYSNIRTLPTLQLSGFKGHSVPLTTLPLTTSPLTATAPSGPMSSFPLLNSLRPRKSQQQLIAKDEQGSASRPKTMYASSYPQQQENPQLDQQTLSPSLSRRVSRVFDFAGGNRQKNDSAIPKIATLESSALLLSSDTMLALGLGTQSSTGGMSTRGYGADLLGPGDGSLVNVRSSMAIKSSPSLTSMSLSLFSTRPSSPTPTGSAMGSQPSMARPAKAMTGRPTSPTPTHTPNLRRVNSTVGSRRPSESAEKATSLGWLRLKPSAASPDDDYQQHSDCPSGSALMPPNPTSLSASSTMLQPTVNGHAISAPTPPPILLDYDLDTSSSLDIPPHLYYSAGGDDVDGDHPNAEDGRETEDDDRSTTTGGDGPRSQTCSKGKGRFSEDGFSVRQSQESYYSQQYHHSSHFNTTDPVLKIAVLKGIYDQILQNMDQLVEHNVQESPAKKNNRFKLLNTLRFLKADRHGSSSGSNNGPYQQQQEQQQQSLYHHQHHSSLSST